MLSPWVDGIFLTIMSSQWPAILDIVVLNPATMDVIEVGVALGLMSIPSWRFSGISWLASSVLTASG